MPRAGTACRGICRTKDGIHLTGLLVAGIAKRRIKIGEASEVNEVNLRSGG
jgi:hypothetical protein